MDIDDERLKFIHNKTGFEITNDINEIVANCEIVFICVPTPTKNNIQVLDYIKNVTEEIGKNLAHNKSYKLIVVRSTVLPYTTKKVILPILEEKSEKTCGIDFGLCTNPEFITEKNSLKDFLNPSRIVIGEYDRKSGEILSKIYEPFNAPIIRTTLTEAELIKYIANTFLTTKISFFNLSYLLSERFGLNSDLINEAVSLDPRIGKYGTVGGRSFNGSCLPKDLEAFEQFLKDNKIEGGLLEEVDRINKNPRLK